MRITLLSRLLGCIVAMVFIATSDCSDPNCQFGPQIADKLNQMRIPVGLVVSCNHTCSQVLCSAKLDVDIVNLKLSSCFGMSLNHCQSPASLGYYIHIPSRNVTRSGTLTQDKMYTETIQGPSTVLGQTSIIISSQLEHVNNTMRYGINAAIKLTKDKIEVFPYKFTVLPTQTINVPPCGNTTQAPPTWPDQCEPLPTPPPTTAGPTIAPKSKTYNKACVLGLLQCRTNEMCVLSGNRRNSGLCKCQSEAALSPATGFCETNIPKSTSKPPRPSVVTLPSKGSDQTTSSAGKSKTNLTVVIACSVVGGILLLAVVVSVIICIGRRRRNAKYRDRLQLLTDEDDDDDTNVVI